MHAYASMVLEYMFNFQVVCESVSMSKYVVHVVIVLGYKAKVCL